MVTRRVAAKDTTIRRGSISSAKTEKLEIGVQQEPMVSPLNGVLNGMKIDARSGTFEGHAVRLTCLKRVIMEYDVKLRSCYLTTVLHIIVHEIAHC